MIEIDAHYALGPLSKLCMQKSLGLDSLAGIGRVRTAEMQHGLTAALLYKKRLAVEQGNLRYLKSKKIHELRAAFP